VAVRVDFESFGLFCPDASDTFVGCEATQGLQSAAVIIGVDEQLEVLPQLFVADVVIALDGGVLDGAVHSFDLAVGPRMVGLGEPVFDAVLTADLVEAMDPVTRCPAVAVLRQVGELDAVIGQDGVQRVWHGFEQRFKECDRGRPVSLVVELGEGELGGAVDRDEQVELAFLGSDLGNIDVEVADWVRLELLLCRLVAGHVGQPADAVALKAAMQGRARQVWDGGLQRVEAVIERQQRMAAEGDDHRLLLDGEHSRVNGLRPHARIADARPLAPLLDGRRADPVTPGERPYALFTPLYRSTDRLSRCGASV